jgi:16S rRNA (uracil1498-N3)-methyltransferase
MSSTPRLFVTQDLAKGAAFPLDDAQSNYLLRVLRLARMRLCACSMAGMASGRRDRRRARQARESPADGGWYARSRKHRPARPSLLFAPVKKSETDFIVEKATELGAARISPVLTERTQTRTVRLDRFQKIVLEAAEQTERLDLPEVEDLQPLANALDALADTVVIFCDERGDDADAPWGGETGRAGPIADVLASLGISRSPS